MYRQLIGMGQKPPGGVGPGALFKAAPRAGYRGATIPRRRWPLAADFVARPIAPVTMRLVPILRPDRPQARVRVDYARPPHVAVSLGQACDPAIQSCAEADPSAVRMDIPAAWLDSFQRFSSSDYEDATEQGPAGWESFCTEWSTRCGMAYARLRANLANYVQVQAAQLRSMSEFLRDNGSRMSSADRTQWGEAFTTINMGLSRSKVELGALEDVAAGRQVIAFDLPGWQFAYVPTAELPEGAPMPTIVRPVTLALTGTEIVVIVAVVSLFVAGGAVAWWAASSAKAEPAKIDAEARRRLAASNAMAMDTASEIARHLAESGDSQTAAAILRMGTQNFQGDIHALTEPDHARAEAAAAEQGESFGDMIKWGLLAFLGIKAMEHF